MRHVDILSFCGYALVPLLCGSTTPSMYVVRFYVRNTPSTSLSVRGSSARLSPPLGSLVHY